MCKRITQTVQTTTENGWIKMDYWMVMKWNELVLDYNVGIHMNKEMDVKNLLDRYENDVDIFYSQFDYDLV
jgi:hypothetical protein